MLKNYFTIAWRNLWRNKVYSLINIIGLTIGLSACLLVATVVIDDLSYDRQWTRVNDLYRIVSVNKMGEGLYDRFGSSFAGLAPELKKSYPEVEAYSELSIHELHLKLDENEAQDTKVQVLNADTSVWKMLDISVLAGNPKHYIEGSNNLLITEKFSNRFFKGQNPVGKIIYDIPSYDDKAAAYLITGVIKNLPSNTHLRADVIKLQKGRIEALQKTQYGTFSQNYLLMTPGANMDQFTRKVNKWYRGFVVGSKPYQPYQYEFQPMKDIYLHSGFAQYQKVKGNTRTIYILSGVAVLLLLIACVNFINLSTARAITRLKESGMRKILGARRKQLVFQFLSESLMFFSLSTGFAIVLYQLSLPLVEVYLGHQLAQTFLSRLSLFVSGSAVILLVSLATGIYPAWLMSGFKPAATLKGNLFSTVSSGQNLLRKSLVVLQFSLSIIVLLAMIIVQQQVRFMDTKDVGFNKNNLLNIAGISWDNKGGAFKNELLRIPGIESASISNWAPSQGAGYMSREIDDPNQPGNKINVWYIAGEAGLAQTLGLRLQTGRLLNEKFQTDAMNEDSLQQHDRKKYNLLSETRPCLVTSSTARILGIKKLNQQLGNVKVVPVGIVADFHNESLHEPMGPTIILAQRSLQYGGMLIRVKPGTEKQVMSSIQKIWKQFYPVKLLEMTRVDDMLTMQYEPEKKLQQLFTFFSGLSMFLAALGVFGLIVHATGQRSKEIGIRKVLGASVAGIVQLLSKDFIKLVIIAIFIASPIAWYAMNKWLQIFAYRIDIEWWVFVLAGILALLIALITVSFQAIKAALANPVKSLRTE